MILLRSPDLAVRLDPRHGAEILDLVDLASGRQLLGRAPFASGEARAGDLDVDTWTASYRGGWQLLVPNAGNACEVDGVLHGYHGRASNDPWEVLEVTEASAAVAWSGHGLRVERRVELDAGALSVSTRAAALGQRVPLVAVEHVALGLELLEPEVEIGFPGGRAYELSESDGPAEPPPGAPEWPEILLRDGSTERGDRWALERPRSRYYVVGELPEGRATVRNAATGQGLELRWDAAWLGQAWVWHEARTYGGPWRAMTEVLVVEPASVPHGLGLAEAIAHGQARWLDPGESCSWSVTVRPLR